VIDPAQLLALVLAALAASTLAAVAGFGGAAILLPVLVGIFGVRDAIPILTVIQLVGNASRAAFNRRQLDLPVVGWFAVGAVPFALLGGIVFAAAPAGFLTRLVGAFLLLSVAWRHTRRGRQSHLPLHGFVAVGGVFSFISALAGTVGPMMAPFFLAYGLVKGAFIGTEALASAVMHVTKLVAYGGASLLTVENVAVGAALGPLMIAGSWAGKRIVDRLPERLFVAIIEAVLVITGLAFLIA